MIALTMPHDGAQIRVRVWDEVASPKGVVQLIHGMNEHTGRYEAFARHLNEYGYVVVADDHRAHGQTAETPEKIGFAPSGADLFSATVRDERFLTDWIADRYGLPIAVIGHSYGSFLTMSYMFGGDVPPTVRGFVLCGSAKLPNALIAAGRLFAQGNPARPAKIVERATFGSYDRRAKGGKNSWLTKDREIVDAYNEDSLVRDAFTKGFYRSFFRGMSRIFRNPDPTFVRDLPILLICGAEDGLGGYGKYSARLYRKLISLGLKDVSFTLYPSDRHELFNETDREKITADVAEHLNRCVQTDSVL